MWVAAAALSEAHSENADPLDQDTKKRRLIFQWNAVRLAEPKENGPIPGRELRKLGWDV